MTPLAQGSTPSPRADGVSDEELVKCFQAGDTSAFDTLFHRYNQALYGYIVHLTDKDRGEDIVQNTFVIVYNKLTFLKEGGCFKTWLYQIATNLIKDQWRHASLVSWLPWIALVKEESIIELDQLEEFEKKVEQEEFIRQVMRKVSQKYRLCTYLDIFQDMRQHEIADLLKMRERTVRRYIARGKEELRVGYNHLVDEQGALKGKESL